MYKTFSTLAPHGKGECYRNAVVRCRDNSAGLACQLGK
jgi:hypothetical protein